MTNTELKNNIDTAITDKTSALSITPANVGEQIKSTVDYIDQEIAANTSTPNYKIYRALITQTSTNAPTVIVLENTLGGNIVWTRTSQGLYNGTLLNAFPADKTFYRIDGKKYLEDVYFTMEVVGVSSIDIYSFNSIGTIGYDSYLSKTPIEIIVYN